MLTTIQCMAFVLEQDYVHPNYFWSDSWAQTFHSIIIIVIMPLQDTTCI